MENNTRSSKGNTIVWILVVIVILIGVYFIVKNSRENAVTPYSTNTSTTYNSTTYPQGTSSSTNLDADFNSASTDLNNIDTNNIDQGL